MKKLIAGFTVACLSFLINLGLVNWFSQPYRDLKGCEVVLKNDLQIMRRAIDQYAIDEKEIPRSLTDLVSKAYLYEIPTDPITKRKDWIIEIGEGTISAIGGKGVVDIRSNSKGIGTEGMAYSDY